jgi:hypothetical protein
VVAGVLGAVKINEVCRRSRDHQSTELREIPEQPRDAVALRTSLDERAARAAVHERAYVSATELGGVVAVALRIGRHDAAGFRETTLFEKALRLRHGSVTDEDEPCATRDDLWGGLYDVVHELKAEETPVVPQKRGYGRTVTPQIANAHGCPIEIQDAGRGDPNRPALAFAFAQGHCNPTTVLTMAYATRIAVILQHHGARHVWDRLGEMEDAQQVMLLEVKVAELQRKVDFLMQHLGLTYADPTPPGHAEIMTLLRQGRMIEAIRTYRELTGAGLKDAKAAVEAMRAGRPPTRPPYR